MKALAAKPHRGSRRPKRLTKSERSDKTAAERFASDYMRRMGIVEQAKKAVKRATSRLVGKPEVRGG